MKYLSKFFGFNKKKETDINDLCKRYINGEYKIENDLITVRGDVSMHSINSYKIPLKFKEVSGNFDISYGSLISLEGCPEIVGGNFDCNYNDLLSLEFAPKSIGGFFDCSSNHLKELKGSPEEIYGDFSCSDNSLINLIGGPKKVEGSFYCYDNLLKTLDGVPKVRGQIYISDNPLPEEILKLKQDILKKVVEEQDFYEIWRDNELFEPRWKELKIDLGI